jgi:hypothetical protein
MIVRAQQTPPLLRRARVQRHATFALLILLGLPLYVWADDSERGVTVDDLVGRTFLHSWTLSPDGKYVAFLAVKAVPRENAYQITLYFQKTTEAAQRTRVAQYSLMPQEVHDADTHELYKTVSQFLWSPDSRLFLYTAHTKARMELRVWNIMTGRERIVLDGHRRVELIAEGNDQRKLRIETFDPGKRERAGTGLPKDPALLVKDAYRFYAPLDNPRRGLPVMTRVWEYSWGDSRARELPGVAATEYLGYPAEYSWHGSLKVLRNGPSRDRHAPQSRARESRKSANGAAGLEVAIEPEKSVVRTVTETDSRTLYEENALLEDPLVSEDGRIAVMSRTTNLVPDELVKLDLTTGEMATLFAPNDSFRAKTRSVRVRFMPIPVWRGKFSGRLFLPESIQKDQRFPLVFTTYLSTPGFNQSAEVPVLSLVEHGIAVFALDAIKATTVIGHTGNFDAELERVEGPRQAMEWVITALASEGLVDPEHVGVSGLSFGAEISMYAYWRSGRFRAVSATTGSWEPTLYVMGGLGFEGFLKSRGFREPEDGAYEQWKRLSAGLNARSTLPPLLWQSPDREESWCIESWFELRRAGAQIEWLDYPDEGHVKRNPASIWWVHERNLDWFRFWLKDEEDSDPRKADQYFRWREMRKNWEAASAAAASSRNSPEVLAEHIFSKRVRPLGSPDQLGEARGTSE